MFPSRISQHKLVALRGGLCLCLAFICFPGCKAKTSKPGPEPARTVGAFIPADPDKPNSAPSQGRAVAAVLMEVNQEVITTDDVLSALAKHLEELGQTYSSQQFRRETERLISEYLRQRTAEILLLNEAEESLDEQGKAIVEQQGRAYRDQLLRESDNSMTALRKKLREQGTTLEKELEKRQRDLQVRRFLAVQFTRRIVVNRQDILDYYNKHRSQYNSPRRVELLQILLLTAKHSQEGDTPAQAQARARQIAQRAWDVLQSGVPFDVVAGEYSDILAEKGGNWGMVAPASLAEPAEQQAARTLQSGQYSGVLQVQRGYSIIGVGKITPAQQKTLEEVQDEIRQLLWEQQYGRLYDQRVTELGRRAVISASPSAVKLAVDLAEHRYNTAH